ncbi:MAG: hypothetical protein JO168_25725 [Solirubrobacterales bacterium]|nr:hypothetical protein [Solirubrobacterales bacterium]MBV9714483.1 hypothetical protein [Solirubrobacterales bacterium]
MQFRRTPLAISLDSGELTIEVPADGYSAPVRVRVGEEVRELRCGERATFAVASASAPSAKLS